MTVPAVVLEIKLKHKLVRPLVEVEPVQRCHALYHAILRHHLWSILEHGSTQILAVAVETKSKSNSVQTLADFVAR